MTAVDIVCNSPDLIYEILNRMSIERGFDYSHFSAAYATCKLWQNTVKTYPTIEQMRKHEFRIIQNLGKYSIHSLIHPKLEAISHPQKLHEETEQLKSKKLDAIQKLKSST